MAQRQNVPTAGAQGANGGLRAFPPEAYEPKDEVNGDAIQRLHDLVGVDFSAEEWETIDGFGQVINA